MPVVRRNARVPHSARQMFDLVSDIDAYPQFLDWCTGARIEGSAVGEVTASVDIGIAGISQSFRTRNTLTEPTADTPGHIAMALVQGPFKRLQGDWSFTPQAGGGCHVAMDLDYELSFSPLKFVLSAIFDEIARSQMSAFVRRAAQVYGDG
jgi:ribosome-associated toxin RatA of RatAB toxin-antitoxin module